MRLGWRLTDESFDKNNHPTMGTHYLWQAILWLMSYPGRAHVYIGGINLNNSDVKVVWHITAMNHSIRNKCPMQISMSISKLSDYEFLLFLLFAVLGDGSVDFNKKLIALTIGDRKYELWSSFIEKMRVYGFREKRDKFARVVRIHSSKAAYLANEWLRHHDIRSIIEVLSLLPDADKLRNIINLAGIKIEPRRNASVDVIDDIKMCIHIADDKGYIELVARRNKEEYARQIQERLKSIGINVRLKRRGKQYAVVINREEIMRHPWLKDRVCEKLKTMHNEAINKGSTEKAQRTFRAITRIHCQENNNEVQDQKT